jgi:guanylate kinase
MREGKLFIISGASGVGKSTVLRKVMAARSDLQFSVSATTRAPRPGETHGVEYYFVTRQQFKDMIQAGEFLEHDAHMGNLYGTPRAQMEEKVRKGHVILDIEPNGAFNVLEKWPQAQLIFIAPPSMKELERRLRNRGDTPEDQILLRLKRATWEMSQSSKYDLVVINDQADACAEQILKFIAEKADA